MAAVTVFVDDAVLGRLPYVCAKTGAPAEGMLTVRTPVRGATGLGVLWLLALAGPLGWLALAVLAWSRDGGGETLTVQVPWTETAQDQHDQALRRRRGLVLSAIALTIGGLVIGGLAGYSPAGTLVQLLLIGAAIVCLAAAWPAWVEVERTRVHVMIDASRRWVTLGNVHIDFAHEVETSRSDHQPAAP
jgi:hypothetical protein